MTIFSKTRQGKVFKCVLVKKGGNYAGTENTELEALQEGISITHIYSYTP